MCLSPTVERCPLFQKEGPAPAAGLLPPPPPAPPPCSVVTWGGVGALGSQADLEAAPGFLAGTLDT